VRQTGAVSKTFRVARNPDASSALPFVIDVPLPSGSMILKAKASWPRTAKIYCHPLDQWPEDAEILEETAVRTCVRRGVAIDLVLDRARENRSQFVFTALRGGRNGIFWQSARTTRKTRPGLRVPTRRSAGGVLEIVVDTRERYAWKFAEQQATTTRRALTVGDYAVELDGDVVGVIERKTLADLAARRHRGRGPLGGRVPDNSRLAVDGGRDARRRAGALPERPDRVLRDSSTRAGVGIPLPGRRPGAGRRDDAVWTGR
jgi:hypothetical protein